MSRGFLNITSRDRQCQNIIAGTVVTSQAIWIVFWYHLFDMSSPLPTVMRNCNVYIEAIIIMSGSTLRTCCEFCIISPIVKQLQTSGKNQWSGVPQALPSFAAIIIMSGSTLRTCCEFRIISLIVKQLQTSGKKQWSTLGFAQLRCSFEACHYSRTCEINRKLSHRKSRLSICIDIYQVYACASDASRGAHGKIKMAKLKALARRCRAVLAYLFTSQRAK